MRTVSLSEIAEQVRGVSYSKADVVDHPSDGYLPVLRANNITEEGLDLGDLVFVRSDKVGQRQKIRSGDIVIAASSGSISVVGKSAQAQTDLEAGFGAFCKVVRPSGRVDHRYIGHFFRTRTYRQKMSALAAGANINNLKNEHIDELEIPLPPLEEQKRIAAILDQADELRRKRQRALDRLNQLGQAIFIEMFGDPRTGVRGWEMIPFSDACEDQTSRSGKLQRGEYLAVGAFPVIDQGQSIIAGFSNDQELVCRSVGPVVIFGDHTRAVKYVDFPFIIGADGAKVLVPSVRFDRRFFADLLRLMPLPDLGYSRHMREVKRLVFPCPPIEKQSEYSGVIACLSESIMGAEGYCDNAIRLFSSLQHRAFRGEL